MTNSHYTALTVAMTLAAAPFSYADLTVEVASAVVAEGTTSLTIPVAVTGSETMTDMNAIVQIAGGGPLAGAPAAPGVTAVDYSGTVWSSAPGGFVSFFASASPPSEIVDPSLSLIRAGESVTAAGTL
ncbi:MAG: hypothetical protein P8J87_19175, partial [Verrucomicrobiales bacterium]|nr:hypothetical protein [Verrucomicrobiales bacterium]